MAFGAHALHEFGHAFAYLEDEYIDGRGSRATRNNPSPRSLFTLSNLSFSDRWGSVPWEHVSPWGRERRQGTSLTPPPVVGWLWRGGEHDRGVWHAEYHCLMNGKHDNYAYVLTMLYRRVILMCVILGVVADWWADERIARESRHAVCGERQIT